ncbi:MAG: glutamine amidotransferase [Deltaproteobacteria bacterium]|nr:glutamine amidotransferase [Deltaproteobacteria bacterium]
MKRLYILKVGTTYPDTAKTWGDFGAWTAAALGELALETAILDVEQGASLPAAAECAGLVITGSHSMVTDALPWSIELEQWIPSLLAAGIPLFGICYGHQLLARASGGEVHFHPEGEEIGTVKVHLLPDCAGDVLFRTLPRTFGAHVVHSQSVLRLPPGSVCLAMNAFEPHQAFRIGECAWGVQFHPEYSAAIMRSYIEHATELEPSEKSERLGAVKETPAAAQVLRNFGRFVADRARGSLMLPKTGRCIPLPRRDRNPETCR